MKLNTRSLRFRIFISMLLIVLITSVLIATVTIFQYKEQTEEYNNARLNRKEDSVKETINYWLTSPQNTYEISTQNLALIFREKIYEIANIENLEVSIYDLQGNLLISSNVGFSNTGVVAKIPTSILTNIIESSDNRHVNIGNKLTKENNSSLSSYTYITNSKSEPIGIINLQYIQDNSAQNKDLKEFLTRMALVYLLMFVFTILIAYILSKFITRSIQEIALKIKNTQLTKKNEKINLKKPSSEIYTLVNAYNNMIDQLEESAKKLAESERKHAWREMAKQVAHEIKNPLTPMKLSVQSFERNFNLKDPQIASKIKDFSKTLIQQIDTMDSIASAFSNFAQMPTPVAERIDVVEIIKHTLHVFAVDYIEFKPNLPNIFIEIDRTQLISMITNLIKNGIQALDKKENKKIEVILLDDDKSVTIEVFDNGKGIPEEDLVKIFEPKFTTKNSGMGLGLALVKNGIEAYKGTISVTSEVNEGTKFIIVLPKN